MVDLPVTERRDPLPSESLRYEAFAYTVERMHCVDAMGPDADGCLEYHYDYTMFQFLSEGASLSARQYKHSPMEAHFLRVADGDEPRFLEDADFSRPLLRAAVAYFRERGVTELTFLDQDNMQSGYSAVPKSLDRHDGA